MMIIGRKETVLFHDEQEIGSHVKLSVNQKL